MRTARGSRTCAQIGSAGRGGASTALIVSGSAARQKTRAQTHPRTRRGRSRVLRGARRHSKQDSAPRELRGGRRALPAHARPLYGRRCAAGWLVGSAASLCSHATLLGRHGRRRTTAACTTPRRRALARSADGCGVYGRSRTPRWPRRNPSPWYGLRMTLPACGRTCWFPSKDQRGPSKMRGGLQRMIKGGRADAGWRRVGPVRAARRRRLRLPDARRVRRADRSEVSGGHEGLPPGSVVKFYP